VTDNLPHDPARALSALITQAITTHALRPSAQAIIAAADARFARQAAEQEETWK